jgi:hypothetical protein
VTVSERSWQASFQEIFSPTAASNYGRRPAAVWNHISAVIPPGWRTQAISGNAVDVGSARGGFSGNVSVANCLPEARHSRLPTIQVIQKGMDLKLESRGTNSIPDNFCSSHSALNRSLQTYFDSISMHRKMLRPLTFSSSMTAS